MSGAPESEWLHELLRRRWDPYGDLWVRRNVDFDNMRPICIHVEVKVRIQEHLRGVTGNTEVWKDTRVLVVRCDLSDKSDDRKPVYFELEVPVIENGAPESPDIAR